MKKTLALFLCAVLVFAFLPVAALSVVAEEGGTIEVPARPTLTSEKVVYMSFSGSDDNDGLTKTTPKKNWGTTTGKGLTSLLTEGAKVVAVGKLYLGANYTLPDFDGNTVLFTAKDVDDTNYFDASTEFGNFLGIKGNKPESANTLTMTGNVIFENIGLLNRVAAAGGDCFTFKAADGAKVVVGTGVVFQNVSGGYAVPKLVVDEGGVVFLDVLGFSRYLGAGTVILNNDLINQIDENTFAEFEGIVADEDGNVLYGELPVEDEHWTSELARPIVAIKPDKESYNYYNKVTLTLTVTNPEDVADWWTTYLNEWYAQSWLREDNFYFTLDGEYEASPSGLTVDSVSDYSLTVTLTGLFSSDYTAAGEGELVAEIPLFGSEDMCLYATAPIAYTGETVPCTDAHDFGAWQFSYRYGEEMEEGHERICENCGYSEFVAEECTPADETIIDPIYDWSGEEPRKTPCSHERTVCTVCGRTLEDIAHHPNGEVKDGAEYLTVWDENKEEWVETPCYKPVTLCKDCGEVLEEGETVHPNGRFTEAKDYFMKWDEDKQEYTEAACYQTGTVCEDCGEWVGEGTSVYHKSPRQEEETETKEPSCAVVGITTKTVVSSCGECGALIGIDVSLAFSEPLGHTIEGGVCARCGKAPAYVATLTADKTSVEEGETLTAVYTLKNPDGTPVAGKAVFALWPLSKDLTANWLYAKTDAVTDENGTAVFEIAISGEDGVEPGEKILYVADGEDQPGDESAWLTFRFGAAGEIAVDETGLATVSEDAITVEENKPVTIDATGQENPAEGVVLTPAAIAKISDAKAETEIKLSDATVLLDAAAMAAIGEKAGQSDVKIAVEVVEENTLSEKQKEALTETKAALVISMDVLVGDAAVSDLGGGKVKVSVPFELPAGVKAGDVRVAYLADDGALTEMPTVWQDGVISFETTHNSTYVVLTAPLPAPATGDGTVIFAALALVSLAAAAVLLSKKAKRETF